MVSISSKREAGTISYFERMLGEAKEQGIVPATLDTAVTAQTLLAYFEGVILSAKGRNDPTLTFRSDWLADVLVFLP